MNYTAISLSKENNTIRTIRKLIIELSTLAMWQDVINSSNQKSYKKIMKMNATWKK
jgi:hypothetical protein